MAGCERLIVIQAYFVSSLELAVRSASINTVWRILNYSLKSEVNLAENNRQLSFHIENNRHKFYSNAVRRANSSTDKFLRI